MKGKFYLRSFLMLMLGLVVSLQMTFAQGRKVSGKVTDAADGSGVPGALLPLKVLPEVQLQMPVVTSLLMFGVQEMF